MSELFQTAGSVLSVGGDDHVTGTAGEAITAGMPCYYDFEEDAYFLSKADAEETAICDGIALNSASVGQPVTIKQDSGDSIINLGATLVRGMTYAVSDLNAGKIMPITDLTTGDYTVVLGVAQSASELKMGFTFAGTDLGT